MDDNTFNIFSLKLLIEEGFHLACESAYSGKEALMMIRKRLHRNQGVYKLILTDINMPEIDGLQLSRMIQKSLERHRSKGSN